MKEKLILQDFTHFGGKHCQTTSLNNILAYHGLDVSEEMLLGLGGGINFIYWYMKQMPAPFVGGRKGDKEEGFLRNAVARIGGKAKLFRTASEKKGHEELKKLLRTGTPALTYVDMAYLPYMALPEEAHFGGHTIAIYGLNEEENRVLVCDRGKQGVEITVEDLKKARNSKFQPFPPKNLLLQLELPETLVPLEPGVKEAIKECSHAMFNQPIKNFGIEGFRKWAGMLPKWPKQFKEENLLACLLNTFIFIEIGGTGGGAFRPMYANFLREAAGLLEKPDLEEAALAFDDCGKLWSDIAVSALPDSWPTLKRIRELSLERNQVFEEQAPGAFEKMLKINAETEPLMKQAAKEMEEEKVLALLQGMKEQVLELYQMEKKAFGVLDEGMS